MHNSSTQISNTFAEYKSYRSWAHYLQPPGSKHLRQYVLLLPYGVLPLAPDLVASMLRVCAMIFLWGCQHFCFFVLWRLTWD